MIRPCFEEIGSHEVNGESLSLSPQLGMVTLVAINLVQMPMSTLLIEVFEEVGDVSF